MRYWSGLCQGDMKTVIEAGAEAMFREALGLLRSQMQNARRLMLMDVTEEEEEQEEA